jgi:hypothetical protein
MRVSVQRWIETELTAVSLCCRQSYLCLGLPRHHDLANPSLRVRDVFFAA